MHPCRRNHTYLPLLLPFAVTLVGLLAACRESAPPPSVTEQTAVGTPEGRFVGSETCRTCHLGEFHAWETSRHRLTLRPEEAGGSPHSAPEGTVPAYRVGKRNREDLWVRMNDRRLQVAPASRDLDANRSFEPLAALQGGPPPADSVDAWHRIGRNADLTCYGCHATGHVLAVAGQDAHGFPIPASRWVETGVGCEACHGPGGPHVDSARAQKRPPRRTHGVTAPDAAATAQVAVCGGCHGLQEPLRSPFANVPAHGYGAPSWSWAEPRLARADSAEFREAVFPDLRPATFQQEAAALAQSGCARKGGLTCARCHDPHSGALREEGGDDRACLPCHADVQAQAEAHARHSPGTPGGRCLDCHLAPILRGPASVPAHDHSLTPPVAGPAEVPAACTQCHLQGEASDRAAQAARLLAGWKSFTQGGKAAGRRRGLTRAFAPDTPPDEAATLLTAIAADPGEAWTVRIAALDRLPGPRRPQLAPALRALVHDANPALRRAAVRSLPAWGNDEDLKALGRLTLDPDPFVALSAVQGFGVLGTADYGARLSETTRRPDLAAEYRAQLALGRAALLAEDWARAEAALTRALDARPFQVHALNDLGIARLRQGKAVEAQRAWLQALEINPRFEAAKRNFEASKE